MTFNVWSTVQYLKQLRLDKKWTFSLHLTQSNMVRGDDMLWDWSSSVGKGKQVRFDVKKDGEKDGGQFWKKNCWRLNKIWDWGRSSPSNRTKTLNIKPELQYIRIVKIEAYLCVSMSQLKSMNKSNWESKTGLENWCSQKLSF